MKRKRFPVAMLCIPLALLVPMLFSFATPAVSAEVQAAEISEDGGTVYADDEVLVPINTFLRNVSKTPNQPSGAAAMSVMPIYVPAQKPDGSSVVITYPLDIAEEQLHAKPLVVTYIDALDNHGIVQAASGASFGQHDAFAAVSFDDGETWRRTNLSRSADKSSFRLSDHSEYPGDVIKPAHKIIGDKILVAWTSKFCRSGTPAYAITDTVTLASGVAYIPAEDDIFGVAGSQRSVDYFDEHPEIGEIPFSCVWTARGTLEAVLDNGVPVLNDAGEQVYTVQWRKAERLTAGVRDANLVSVAGAKKAGFMLTWQEDPEGLRPGEGEGPGAGWSGATVHHKTDIWYSFIHWDDFDAIVEDDSDESADGNRQRVAVPLSVPVRLTDNDSCDASDKALYDADPATYTGGHEYCYALENLCAETVEINASGQMTETCMTADGRVLDGNTGASRARIALQPYTQTNGAHSAWAIIGYEESKGLGDCEDEEDGHEPGTSGAGGDPVEKIDEGKNVMYHSFDFQAPDLVHPGYMLNSIPLSTTTSLAETIVVTEGNRLVTLYDTEIARRFGLMTQPGNKIGESGTSQLLIYKQGTIKQGGPADIFAVRFAVPDTFDPEVDNPYTYANRDCNEWSNTAVDGYAYYADEMYRVDGAPWADGLPLCMSFGVETGDEGHVIETLGALNVSAVSSTTVDYTTSVTETKLVSWTQSVENLNDQSWENPLTVAKGHRGFIDGDFIMLMYAWSPNWNANKVGHDSYNLYIRRSFDGGLNWTTTPATLGGDGTTTCEWYGAVGAEELVCTDYAAGEFEPARNVSQLVGTRETILDPRYSPTPPDVLTEGSYLYEDDKRDPSTFFIVYETGDNTTVAEGEAVPLDLFYSRAYNWGDNYVVLTKTDSTTGEDIEYWDALEKKDDESGEASIRAVPDGSRFYAVWNQQFEVEHEVFDDSDVMFRKVHFYLPDEIEALAAVTMQEDQEFVFDRDTGSGIFVRTEKGRVDINLSVDVGTLTLGSFDDITFTLGDGIDDAAIGFSGWPGAVNRALKGMRYRPPANFNGQVAMRIRAGFSNDEVVAAATSLQTTEDNILNATTSISVLPVNDLPIARDDIRSVAEDGVIAIAVCANDRDIDNDPLTVAETTWPANGTLEVSDNIVTYRPQADFNGTDGFEYTVDDGHNGRDSAMVVVEVIAASDGPTIAADIYHTIEDYVLTVDAAAGLLSNDHDPDGDTLLVVLEQDVSHGTLNLNANGSFTYRPEADFVGEDSFTYFITDGQQNSTTAQVTIVVAEEGDGEPGDDTDPDGDDTDPDGDDTDPDGDDTDPDGDDTDADGDDTDPDGDDTDPDDTDPDGDDADPDDTDPDGDDTDPDGDDTDPDDTDPDGDDTDNLPNRLFLPVAAKM